MAQSDLIDAPAGEPVPPTEAVSSTGEELPYWKRNFAANFLDVSFFSLGMAFGSMTTIVPLFIRELGGSNLLVGMVPAIVQTGFVLPPLFVAPYVSRLRRTLPYVLRVTLGERIPWFILALLTFWFGIEYPGLVLGLSVALLAIFGLSGGLTMPGWMDMVATVTPLRMRGKLFGWSGALGGLTGVGGGLLAEYALDRYAFPANYALCFLAAGICMMISFFALCAIRELPRTQVAPVMTVRQYIERLPPLLRRDREFTAFLVARTFTVLGSMAVAFIAVYATEQRGLPESLAGRYTSWMLGVQVITTPFWGMIGDRRGHKAALQFGLLCTALSTVLALIVTTPAGFYVVFALLGASTGIQFTTTLNMVVEFATPAERVTYIGLHGTLIAPATLLAPLVGGWVAQFTGFPPLFITATACSLIGFLILTFFTRDPRYRQTA
jgi:MFS family permease